MKKVGQAVILFIFLSFIFLIGLQPYYLFLYILLGLVISLLNPFFYFVFLIPLYFFDNYSKILILTSISIYILLRLIWKRKRLIYFSYFFILSLTFIYIHFLYNYSILSASIYYIITLILGLLIIKITGVSSSKTKLIDFRLAAIILLTISLALLTYYKPIYHEYFFIIFLLLFTFYLPWYNLLIIPLIYYIFPNHFFIFLLGIVLFNYKSLPLYILFLISYYGFIKPNINNTEFIFITIYLVFLCFYNNFDKQNKLAKNNLYSILSTEFYSYLNELDGLLETRNSINQNFDQLYKDFINSNCFKCNKKNTCINKPDIHLFFVRSVSLYHGKNLIQCPNYDNIEKIPLTDTKEYYSHQAIKTLLYSFQCDVHQLQALNKNYQDFLIKLQKEKIPYQNFIPAFFEASFSLELMMPQNSINGYFMKLCDYHFKDSLDYRFEQKEHSIFVTVSKKPNIKISYAHAIMNKGHNTISGDNFLIKKTNDKRFIFALSDGMGSGNEAYYASKELLEMVSSMLKYHFSTTTLLNFLSYIYEIKGNYEAYATLDLLQINTTNSKANLYKLGSSTTYLFSDVDKIYENSSLPLNYADLIDSYEIKLKKGDIIILLSDGFTDYIGHKEMKELIANLKYSSASLIVGELCSYIKNKYQELKDDCSIIVVKVN